MCGIAGLWARNGAAGGELAPRVNAMTLALRHRGPDDSGTFVDEPSGLALGHRRLSIIDLSVAGHQPMTSANGRYVISYNGEIYNFADLRAELEARGVRFRGGSDTEVIVEGCARFGIEAMIGRLNGMFAIALWDAAEKRLYLARDRMGEKPLYWAAWGPLMLFGSELKALRAVPGWKPCINTDAIVAFMRLSYIPAPHTIYSGVYKLPPGCLLSIGKQGAPQLQAYWTMTSAIERARAEPLALDEQTAVDELDVLLSDAVARRMVSDVPLGAFLSGGYDSSTIVALMQKASSRPVKTFTISFDHPGFDEAPHAEAVARHLGTAHTTFTVSGADALSIIPKLPQMYDEPFADSSQLPTHVVSALTRQHVKVALSGDGGDELFTGYNRYQWAERIWGSFAWAPGAVRHAAAAAIRVIPSSAFDDVFGRVPGLGRMRQLGHKANRIADILAMPSMDAVYHRLVSQADDPAQYVIGGSEARAPAWSTNLESLASDPIDRMRYLDLCTYLPDDILAKVDRASMAVALEVRVPFLDHRVVEWVWRLPAALNTRAARPKHLLRRVLGRHVPPSLTDRPKMGFGVPLGAWLRGPLRDWAEDLLSIPALSGGVLQCAPIRSAWERHLRGSDVHQYLLWNILTFQAWRREWDRGDVDSLTAAAENQPARVAYHA